MLFFALHRPGHFLLGLTVAALVLSGCAPKALGQAIITVQPVQEVETSIPIETSQPLYELPTPTITITQTPARLDLWVDTSLPGGFRTNLSFPEAVSIVSEREKATLWLEIVPDTSPAGIGETPYAISHWIYTVAAPFPTLTDEVSLLALRRAWEDRPVKPFTGTRLLMTPETRAALEAHWGPPGQNAVREIASSALLEAAWQEQTAWVILPFEAIEPRWKVLRVEGQSPLDQTFEPERYPLAIPVRLDGMKEALQKLSGELELPGNYDPDKRTVLMMTGVTALSRHIGAVMEEKGVTYPARSIDTWLTSADLTHISNEVSFYQDCPKPGPLRADMRFCSNPKYIQLLEAVGTDIVELTGNHNLDWGFQPYFDTLEMYRQRGWKTFGGGANLEEARQPLFIEHNGNQLVFLGCSPAGPEAVWATPNEPGSAPCDMDDLEAQVRQLRSDGYLPIVTLQAFEADTYQPPPAQGAPDFRKLAQAGAVIVSGSQSHIPQTMTFVGDSFVHYGLGNLFFDQMTPAKFRQQFIDRHVFYDGRYLGVELLTTLLEESARPRPMTSQERSAFLQDIFSLCDWSNR